MKNNKIEIEILEQEILNLKRDLQLYSYCMDYSTKKQIEQTILGDKKAIENLKKQIYKKEFDTYDNIKKLPTEQGKTQNVY